MLIFKRSFKGLFYSRPHQVKVVTGYVVLYKDWRVFSHDLLDHRHLIYCRQNSLSCSDQESLIWCFWDPISLLYRLRFISHIKTNFNHPINPTSSSVKEEKEVCKYYRPIIILRNIHLWFYEPWWWWWC